MIRFLARRSLYGLMAILGATIIVFALSRAAGDPRTLFVPEGYGMSPEQWDLLGRKMGLDRPIPIQYGMWLARAARGDLGDSLIHQRPVSHVLRQKAMATVSLAIAAWVFGTAVGVPLGVLSALKRASGWDYAARLFALLGQVLPPFWIGIVAILIFSFKLRWLPSGSTGEGIAIRNYILPAVVLGWLPAAAYLRFTRSAMLEVLDSEYIKLARAKGLREFVVVWKHAFRNALITPLTYSALLLAGFITGAVVVETVFSWPGLGRLAAEAVWQNDFPVLTGIVLIAVVLYVSVTLLLDIVYSLVDPRISHS